MKKKFNQLKISHQIKTIVISGSMRFKHEMIVLSNKLKIAGYKKIIEPSSKEFNESEGVIGKAVNHKIFGRLIKSADLLLIYNKNGYVGLSTAMEIQMAIDCNVPVRFLFEPEEIEFKALCIDPDYNVKVDTKFLK